MRQRGVVACVATALTSLAVAACTPDGVPGSMVVAPETNGSLGELAERVQRYVAQVWPRTEQIWPGVDFGDHVLLLADDQAAWQIDTAGVEDVPLTTLADREVAVPQPGGFGMLSWDGRDAVVIRPVVGDQGADPTGLDIADPAMKVFALATHEQFHAYVQESETAPWVSLDGFPDAGDGEGGGDGGRTDLYPLQAEPRLLRVMVYNSLLAAYQEPDARPEHLAAAAFWHQRWEAEYPDEQRLQAPTDLAEGTAKYFELVAGGMAAAADPDSASQRRDYLTRRLAPMEIAYKAIEPYAIGAAALLVADDAGMELTSSLSEQARTPLSYLIQDVAPVEQEVPPEVEDGVAGSTAEMNEQLSGLIEPFVTDIQDERRWVLMAAVDKLVQGNLGGMGFYTTEELPVTIVPRANGAFRFDGGELILGGATVAKLGEYLALPLDPADPQVTLDGDRLTLSGPNLHGSFPVTSQTDNGQRFLYAR